MAAYNSRAGCAAWASRRFTTHTARDARGTVRGPTRRDAAGAGRRGTAPRRRPCSAGNPYAPGARNPRLLKAIGVLTQDFAAYYELVGCLKQRDLGFYSLAFGEPVPPSVGVIITTPPEAGRVAFPQVVLHRGQAERTVDLALERLQGKPRYRTVIVGVDPGERPGLAVFGDGRLLRVEQVARPEDVLDEVAHAMESFAADHVIVRVGHGGGALRDRILRPLLASDRTSHASVEVVDETSTTPPSPDELGSDIAAAKSIAMAQGSLVDRMVEVRPSEGEVRDIQRKSRIASQGLVTISRDLARDVARGKLSLDEAIARQRSARA